MIFRIFIVTILLLNGCKTKQQDIYEELPEGFIDNLVSEEMSFQSMRVKLHIKKQGNTHFVTPVLNITSSFETMPVKLDYMIVHVCKGGYEFIEGKKSVNEVSREEEEKMSQLHRNLYQLRIEKTIGKIKRRMSLKLPTFKINHVPKGAVIFCRIIVKHQFSNQVGRQYIVSPFYLVNQ
jgi:hypothetical protein